MVQLDDNIIATVNDALEKRNYLTHKFFWKHNFAIRSVEGRKIMLAEIREIQESLSLAHTVLTDMTDSLRQVDGQLLPVSAARPTP